MSAANNWVDALSVATRRCRCTRHSGFFDFFSWISGLFCSVRVYLSGRHGHTSARHPPKFPSHGAVVSSVAAILVPHVRRAASLFSKKKKEEEDLSNVFSCRFGIRRQKRSRRLVIRYGSFRHSKPWRQPMGVVSRSVGVPSSTIGNRSKWIPFTDKNQGRNSKRSQENPFDPSEMELAKQKRWRELRIMDNESQCENLESGSHFLRTFGVFIFFFNFTRLTGGWLFFTPAGCAGGHLFLLLLLFLLLPPLFLRRSLHFIRHPPPPPPTLRRPLSPHLLHLPRFSWDFFFVAFSVFRVWSQAPPTKTHAVSSFL